MVKGLQVRQATNEYPPALASRPPPIRPPTPPFTGREDEAQEYGRRVVQIKQNLHEQGVRYASNRNNAAVSTQEHVRYSSVLCCFSGVNASFFSMTASIPNIKGISQVGPLLADRVGSG